MAGLGESGAASGAIRAGRAFVELFAKDNSVYRSLDRLQARFRQIGQFMMRVGATTAIAGGAALKPAVETFVAFDDAIRAVKAATQATESQFDSMRERALELGRTTSYTAAEVAKLMLELGRAGFDPEQINVMTESVLALARATGTEAATSAGIMSAAIRQFGLDATDAARVADVLTAGANLSFNSVESLGEALKYVGPVAKSMGVSLEDAVAILGTLGNMGIQGSEAGTAFRRILTATGAEAKKLFETFGVNSVDAAGNVRPLVDVLDDVQKSVKGLGNAERAQKFDQMFGLLGITSAVAISENAKGVRELRDEIGKSSGVASRTAKEMDSGLGGSIRFLKSAVEGTVIAFGEALAPVLMTTARVTELVSGSMRSLIANNRDVATTVAGVIVGVIAAGAALASLGVAFTVTGMAVGAVVTVLKLIAILVATLLSPVGLLTAGMVALGVAFATGTDAGKKMVAGLGSGFKELNDTFQLSWGGITAAVKKGDLGLAFKIAGAGLRLEWSKVVLYWTEQWGKFRDGFLKDLHEIAMRIENTFLWRAGAWAGDKAGKAGGVVVDSFKGDARAGLDLPANMFGDLLGVKRPEPEEKPFGMDAVAAAAKAMEEAAANRRVSTIGLTFAPALGDEMGQMIGIAVADAVNAELNVDPAIRKANADIAAAQAELRALVEQAKEGIAEAPMPREVGKNFQDKEIEKWLTPPKLDIAQIKGAFAVPSARSQFGYADSFKDSPAKQQVDLLGKIVDGVAGLPAGLAARLAQAFKPR